MFKELLISAGRQEPPSHQSHVFLTDQNFANNFWKGDLKEHLCEIISKSDQRFQRREFLRISQDFYRWIAQVAPIHQSHIFWRIKILGTDFEKGHPRNISVKLFQNLTSRFQRRRFLKNFI